MPSRGRRWNNPRMTLILIGGAVLVAVLAFLFLRKSPGAAASTPTRAAAERPAERRLDASRAPATQSAKAAPPSDATIGDAPAAGPQAAPAALAGFNLQRAVDLPEERRQAYVSIFKEIPRPPRLLHRLLSPEFVNEASSTELVDLIVGEPLIAAKVLATINSPAYGLSAPVSSIGQAVTYLGLNTVRSLCLQYILIASFKADSPERKQMLDAAWNASALASELMQQLAQRLGFEDRGSLVSGVVLSFLGRLATTAAMPRDQLATIPPTGLLDRTIAEQNALGLCASQIGRLLMNDWGLPDRIVDDAAEIDTVLVTPSGAFGAERGSRLALCFVAARIGERLAEGRLADVAAFDTADAGDAELFHLRSYLTQPMLARLTMALRTPEVGAGVQRMLATMRR